MITADYIVKQLEDQADHFQTLPENFQSILHKNYKGADQEKRYLQLKKIKEIIENYRKYHTSKILSDWDNAKKTDWVLATNPTGFRDRNAITDHLYMQRREVAKYELMPTMAWTQNYLPEHKEDIGKSFWKATRCNVFVGDFSKEVLGLPTYPWGTTQYNANGIYEHLGEISEFIELNWGDVSKYTNAGFPVYIATPTDGTAGHIAISFPGTIVVIDKGDDKPTETFHGSAAEVVQAGASIGKIKVNEAWSSIKLKDIFFTKAKAYLFLGHLSR